MASCLITKRRLRKSSMEPEALAALEKEQLMTEAELAAEERWRREFERREQEMLQWQEQAEKWRESNEKRRNDLEARWRMLEERRSRRVNYYQAKLLASSGDGGHDSQ